MSAASTAKCDDFLRNPDRNAASGAGRTAEQSFRFPQENDRENREGNDRNQAGVQKERAELFGETEHDAGDEAAEDMADAAHHDHDQRLHGEGGARGRVHAEEHRDQDAGACRERAASSKGKRAIALHIDADERGRFRVARNRAQRASGLRIAKCRIDAERQHEGCDQRDDAVRGKRERPEFHDVREIRIGAVGAGPQHQRHALQHEQEAEGRDDRIDFALALIARARKQGVQHIHEEKPARGECRGYPEHERDERRRGDQRESPERGIARKHQEFAIGEIEYARDAVLEIQADRDQRVDAADHEARDHEIEEQSHATQTPAARAEPRARKRAATLYKKGPRCDTRAR